MAELEDEGIDKLTAKLKDSESYWTETVDAMARKLTCSAKEVVQLQAELLSSRQQLNEQIKTMSYQLYKLMPKIKSLKKTRFEYYAGAGAPYATNASERMKLIEWDIASLDHKKDVLDVHIDFLRETQNVMVAIGYAVKNKVSLYQLTELE